MMAPRAIYKYRIPVTDDTVSLDLPVGAQVIHVGAESESVLLVWVLFDAGSSIPTQVLSFRVFGTGHLIPPDMAYVGTAVVAPFVWHLFEVLAR